jgi:hypothetical protein
MLTNSQYPPKVNANSPKSYVDTDGNGIETVLIDGSGSHTHFQVCTMFSDFCKQADGLRCVVHTLSSRLVSDSRSFDSISIKKRVLLSLLRRRTSPTP